MARLTLTLTVTAGESWRLLEALRSLMVPARLDHGCRRCLLELSNDASDPSRIRYIEDWTSDEDLQFDIRSDRFPRLLAVMEQALEPPDLSFELASGTRGLDYVAEVRGDRDFDRPAN